MKRRFIVVISIVFFSSITRGMDDPAPTKKNPTPSPKDDLQLIKEIASDALNVGETVVQIVEDEKKEQQPKPRTPPIIPPVNITGGSATGRDMGLLTNKRSQKSVDNVADLRGHMKDVSTQRTARIEEKSSRQQDKKKNLGDTGAGSDPSQPKKLLVPTAMAKHLPDDQDESNEERLYTEDEIWEKLKRWSPTVYEVAQKHNTPIDSVDFYFDCINEGNIRPGAIIEYMSSINQKLTIWQKIWKIVTFGCARDINEQQLEELHREYEEFEKNNPDKYKAIICELLQSIDAGNDNPSSSMTNVHNGIQQKQINDLAAKGSLKDVGLAITTFLSVVQIIIPILQSNGIIPVHNNGNQSTTQ